MVLCGVSYQEFLSRFSHVHVGFLRISLRVSFRVSLGFHLGFDLGFLYGII